MEFTTKLVTKAIHLNSSFVQLYLWIANPTMICDLRDMTAFLCFHSRWWGWENWLSRLRTANSALSARHPSSLRLSSHWRRTITPASCKQLKISLKGKDVPLNKKKNLIWRKMGCHNCCIALSHQRCGQRQGCSWHIPPKCYFVLYQIGNAKSKHSFEKRSSQKGVQTKSYNNSNMHKWKSLNGWQADVWC